MGIAVGSWAAGLALASPLGPAGPPAVGTVISALTLVPLIALAVQGPPTRSARSRVVERSTASSTVMDEGDSHTTVV
ncbi:hypothetical protein [Streptomyces sp. DSM 40750]|uniref:hypothetical protein n=1 Tax=Streptomyces sp. DSM 40750 TaxID=2801030 RepID=UPI0027D46412|nr:hypothetical protein [Streptomyces sp. DSM 40750]